MLEPAAYSTQKTPRWGQVIVVLILGIYGLTALYSITNKSATADEGIHLTGGYSYWAFNDYRLQPENGNLPQRWGAIPLMFQNLNQFDRDHPFWKRGDVWQMEWIFLYNIGNDPYWMLFTARAMMILGAIIGCFILFRFSTSIWGYGGGLLSLVLCCFSPDVLAHGRLITSDIMGASALIAAIWAVARLMQTVTPWRIVITGASFGILAVSKYYAVLMVPIVGIIVSTQLVLMPETVVEIKSRKAFKTPPSRALAWVGTFACVGLIAWGVLWSFYGFRYSGFNDDLHHGEYLKTWEAVEPQSELIAAGIEFVRETKILPEAYAYGFAHVIKHSEFRHAFLAGNYSSEGWWYFFIFSFLFKSPIALFGLLTLGLILLLAARKKLDYSALKPAVYPLWLPVLILFCVYGSTALMTNLNIGHRHILPVYFSIFILLGALWKVCAQRGVPSVVLLSILCAGYALETISVYPNFLAFFNRLVGGPAAGHQLLVDSSLDWGQDLYALEDWLSENNSGPDKKDVTMSYFGRSSPRHHEMDVRYFMSRGTFLRESYSLNSLKPGLWATSATMLQGMYSPDLRPWTAEHEGKFQFLLKNIERLTSLAPDEDAMLALIQKEGAENWANLINLFTNYRAERMRIQLLNLEPVAVVNHTFFIHDISQEQLDAMMPRADVGFPDDFPVRQFSNKHSRLIESEIQP